MKSVEVEKFRDVEVYPDEELFVVVVRKNFKLCLDRLACFHRGDLHFINLVNKLNYHRSIYDA
ncbi:hypothetical protein Taro_043688 [Colocasia esculenta]|uniref:Uncharacterized protein n=1 Tax=Colocasia esculenta TaxID=4460 RepID=A0A843X4F9_COLES|nr:hypothetical protein [Colocasia esculenta]